MKEHVTSTLMQRMQMSRACLQNRDTIVEAFA